MRAKQFPVFGSSSPRCTLLNVLASAFTTSPTVARGISSASAGRITGALWLRLPPFRPASAALSPSWKKQYPEAVAAARQAVPSGF